MKVLFPLCIVVTFAWITANAHNYPPKGCSLKCEKECCAEDEDLVKPCGIKGCCCPVCLKKLYCKKKCPIEICKEHETLIQDCPPKEEHCCCPKCVPIKDKDDEKECD